MSEKAILRIDNAQKYYNRGRENEIHVMNGISLSLPESGMIAIFGKSGCGKTTLLNTIGGLDSLASGSIEIFGENLANDPDIIRNRYTGYIFQNYNLNVGETVFENVADALRLCGVEDEQVIRTRVLAALVDVDMDKFRERTPDTLSGGQQQRVAIARAIVKSPAIILADEPTGNLDENNTVLVMDILKEISRTRLVLLVTHEANLVDYYCDRVIEMADGRIIGDRVNTGATGYVQRNKNDIFLGDLATRTDNLPGVSLTTYGDLPADRPVHIRLVSEGGRLFLACDTPGVRFLDETSEIHLREGSFQTTADTAHANRGGKPLDMSALGPIEGGHFGRLYHFRNALSLAWRENYSQRRKRGKRFLRVCLIMLAIVMVFTTASSAVDLKGYITSRKEYDPDLFFIPVEADKAGNFGHDYNALVGDTIGQNGINGAQLVTHPNNVRGKVQFRTAGFMTAQSEPTLSAQGYTLPLSMLRDAELVCGRKEVAGVSEILITTAMADDLLASSEASYIKSYEDLLGLTMMTADSTGDMDIMIESTDMGMGTSSALLSIAGIVRSSEKAYLLPDLVAAQRVLRDNMDLPVIPLSLQTRYKGELKNGEVAVLGDGVFKVGETLTVLGRNFTVREIITTWADPNLYPQYVLSVKGETLLSLRDYIGTQSDSGLSEGQLLWQYLFEYFPRYLPEFLREGAETTDSALWLYAEKESMASLYSYLYGCDFNAFGLPKLIGEMAPDAMTAWEAYCFRQGNGRWPTMKELESVEYDSWKSEHAWMEERYIDEIKRQYDDTQSKGSLVVSDADYIALSYSVGATDGRLDVIPFGTEGIYGQPYRSAYLMVHAADRAAAEEYLRAQFGDALVTRDTLLRQNAGDLSESFVTAGISLTVILAFMCLCVFFIMRSSFMSRVREVGILRAIGVSRKNLLYRFLIETVMLTLLTVFIGFLVASLLMMYLSGAAFFNQLLYFPLWLASGLLAVILTACILFGLLPAMLLLRRTPSEILSKYDI